MIIELTVGIVSYNTRDLTCRCIDSVLNATAHFQSKVVLADNGSTDGTLDSVRRKFPEVHLISFPDNPGYGEALNRIFEQFPAQFILAMNADVMLGRESLDHLQRYLVDHRECALVGPSLVWSNGKHQRSCKKFPSIRSLIIELFALDIFPPINYWSKNLDYDDSKFEIPTEVDSLSGSVMLIRESAFREINGFDNGFRLYFEETDLCRRLWNTGYNVLYVPRAKAVHIYAASTRHTMERQITYYISCARYARKHFSSASYRITYMAILLSTVMRMVALIIKYFPITGSRRHALTEKLRACLIVVRNLGSKIDIIG
jgi:hypothetical protein